MRLHLRRDASRPEETHYRDALAAAHARIEALEHDRRAAESSGALHDDPRFLRLAVALLLIAAAVALAFGGWCVLG